MPLAIHVLFLSETVAFLWSFNFLFTFIFAMDLFLSNCMILVKLLNFFCLRYFLFSVQAERIFLLISNVSYLCQRPPSIGILFTIMSPLSGGSRPRCQHSQVRAGFQVTDFLQSHKVEGLFRVLT